MRDMFRSPRWQPFYKTLDDQIRLFETEQDAYSSKNVLVYTTIKSANPDIIPEHVIELRDREPVKMMLDMLDKDKPLEMVHAAISDSMPLSTLTREWRRGWWGIGNEPELAQAFFDRFCMLDCWEEGMLSFMQKENDDGDLQRRMTEFIFEQLQHINTAILTEPDRYPCRELEPWLLLKEQAVVKDYVDESDRDDLLVDWLGYLQNAQIVQGQIESLHTKLVDKIRKATSEFCKNLEDPDGFRQVKMRFGCLCEQVEPIPIYQVQFEKDLEKTKQCLEERDRKYAQDRQSFFVELDRLQNVFDYLNTDDLRQDVVVAQGLVKTFDTILFESEDERNQTQDDLKTIRKRLDCAWKIFVLQSFIHDSMKEIERLKEEENITYRQAKEKCQEMENEIHQLDSDTDCMYKNEKLVALYHQLKKRQEEWIASLHLYAYLNDANLLFARSLDTIPFDEFSQQEVDTFWKHYFKIFEDTDQLNNMNNVVFFRWFVDLMMKHETQLEASCPPLLQEEIQKRMGVLMLYGASVNQFDIHKIRQSQPTQMDALLAQYEQIAIQTGHESKWLTEFKTYYEDEKQKLLQESNARMELTHADVITKMQHDHMITVNEKETVIQALQVNQQDLQEQLEHSKKGLYALTQDLQTHKQHAETLTQTLETKTKELDLLQKELQDSRQNNRRLNSDNRRRAIAIGNKQKEIQALGQKLKAANKKVADQKNLLKKQTEIIKRLEEQLVDVRQQNKHLEAIRQLNMEELQKVSEELQRHKQQAQEWSKMLEVKTNELDAIRQDNLAQDTVSQRELKNREEEIGRLTILLKQSEQEYQNMSGEVEILLNIINKKHEVFQMALYNVETLKQQETQLLERVASLQKETEDKEAAIVSLRQERNALYYDNLKIKTLEEENANLSVKLREQKDFTAIQKKDLDDSSVANQALQARLSRILSEKGDMANKIQELENQVLSLKTSKSEAEFALQEVWNAMKEKLQQPLTLEELDILFKHKTLPNENVCERLSQLCDLLERHENDYSTVLRLSIGIVLLKRMLPTIIHCKELERVSAVWTRKVDTDAHKFFELVSPVSTSISANEYVLWIQWLEYCDQLTFKKREQDMFDVLYSWLVCRKDIPISDTLQNWLSDNQETTPGWNRFVSRDHQIFDKQDTKQMIENEWRIWEDKEAVRILERHQPSEFRKHQEEQYKFYMAVFGLEISPRIRTYMERMKQ